MRYQTKLRYNATLAEKMFYLLFKDYGLNIVFQKYFHRKNGKVYFPDFQLRITRYQCHLLRTLGYKLTKKPHIQRILVEIDGEYHQFTRSQDQIRQKELETKISSHCQYHVVRFTNAEVLNTPDIVKDRLHQVFIRFWGIDFSFKTVREVMFDNMDQQKEYYFNI